MNFIEDIVRELVFIVSNNCSDLSTINVDNLHNEFLSYLEKYNIEQALDRADKFVTEQSEEEEE